MFEVEIKFFLPDPDAFLKFARARFNLVFTSPVVESDLFFNHPDRDFAQTDECLRLRTSVKGAFLTYKGQKLDSQTKTREELEFQVAPAGELPGPVRDAWSVFWRRLGFLPVATVEKARQTAHTTVQGKPVSITFDRIVGLGYFTEFEVVAANPEDVPAARVLLLHFAEEWGLNDPINKSYLELLTEKQEK